MLIEARSRYAEAIRGYFDPGVVGVNEWRPDTAAGPCVWIELESVTWAGNVLSVNLRAVGMSPERDPDLDVLTDNMLAAAIAVGAARGTVARPGTRTIGDVAWPTVEVTAQMVVNHCDLPQPLARTNGG